LDIRDTGDPVKDEGDERVEGEKVWSKGDDEVRFRYRDASAAITGVKGLHGSSEEHREKGVRQFVSDDIGKYRLSKKEMDGQVGQTASEKEIGGIQFEAGGKNHRYQLPGESHAEGNECQAEKDFQYSVCHLTEVGKKSTGSQDTIHGRPLKNSRNVFARSLYCWPAPACLPSNCSIKGLQRGW
jgi:hypothetical protein